MQEKIISISPQGNMRFIHDDRLAGLLDHGEAQIKRASNVEPGDPAKGQDPKQWYADLSPVNGPTLGPFPFRSTALQEEVKWLNENCLTTKSSS